MLKSSVLFNILASLQRSQNWASWTRNCGGPRRRDCEAFLSAVWRWNYYEEQLVFFCLIVCKLEKHILSTKGPKVAEHVQTEKTMAPQGTESALREILTIIFVFVNVTYFACIVLPSSDFGLLQESQNLYWSEHSRTQAECSLFDNNVFIEVL